MHLTDKELIFMSQTMAKLQFKVGAGEDFATAENLNKKIAEEFQSRQNEKETKKEK